MLDLQAMGILARGALWGFVSWLTYASVETVLLTLQPVIRSHNDFIASWHWGMLAHVIVVYILICRGWFSVWTAAAESWGANRFPECASGWLDKTPRYVNPGAGDASPAALERLRELGYIQ